MRGVSSPFAPVNPSPPALSVPAPNTPAPQSNIVNAGQFSQDGPQLSEIDQFRMNYQAKMVGRMNPIFRYPIGVRRISQ